MAPRTLVSAILSALSTQVSLARMGCNSVAHADLPFVMAVDSCTTFGANSHMHICQDDESAIERYWTNDNCDGSHWYEGAVNSSYAVVCDAGPCRVAVVENYPGGSESGDSSDSSDGSDGSESSDGSGGSLTECTGHCGAGGDAECGQEPELVWYCESCNCKDLGDRADSDSSDGSWASESSDEWSNATNATGSTSAPSTSSAADCEFDSAPVFIQSIIVNECLPVLDSDSESDHSMKYACDGADSASLSYYTNDENHECSGEPAAELDLDEDFGAGCTMVVVCNVEAGGDDDGQTPVLAFCAPLVAVLAWLSQ